MSSLNPNQFYKKFNAERLKSVSGISNFKNIPSFTPKSLNIKKYTTQANYIFIGITILLIVGFILVKQVSSNNIFNFGGDIRGNAPAPVATQILNKEFKFPLLDEKGKEVAQISYILVDANLQDAFIYQGKLAKAVKGRTFLIFNLKITNPYSKTLQINAKDYLRVKLNDSNEQLASEIHNDPVEIQADSTKYTRIGLPINDMDRNIILLIGELNGKKETIKLTLTR